MKYFAPQLIFFVCLFSLISAMPSHSPLIMTAERLFNEQLYEDAQPLYAHLLTQNNENSSLFLLRLTTCLIQQKAPQQALSLLYAQKQSVPFLYLTSIAHRQLKQSHQALVLLNALFAMPDSSTLTPFIQLEKGWHYVQLQQPQAAAKLFKEVIQQTISKEAAELAYIFLIKLHIQQNEFSTAHALLDAFHPTSSLLLERNYLEATLLFLEGRYQESEKIFEKIQASSTHALPFVCRALCSFYKAPHTLETFNLAEKALKQAIEQDSQQNYLLMLADLYFTQAKRFKDETSYQKGQTILQQIDPTFSSIYVQSWLMKGLYAFEQGIEAKKSHQQQAQIYFKQALEAFSELLPTFDQLNLENQKLFLKGYTLTQNNLLNTTEACQQLMKRLSFPCLELNCLVGWTALQITNEEVIEQAIKQLKAGRLQDPYSSWIPASWELEGLLRLKQSQWELADQIFDYLIQNFPQSQYGQEAWFWRAYGAEKKGNLTDKQLFLAKASEANMTHRYAAVAYFLRYSMQDYLHGNRQALKHLQAMPTRFPSDPLSIQAYYLLGLDYKKDHKDPQGRFIHSNDQIAAIDAFQAAESLYDRLAMHQSLNDSLTIIRWLAQLERAQANLAVAEEASGGKRQIYLDYAEKVFIDLQEHLQSVPFPYLWAENSYGLAQTYRAQNKMAQSEQILDFAIARFQVQSDYYLFKLWNKKGEVAFQQQQYPEALKAWMMAEQVAEGWSEEECLTTWIQQSQCYQQMNQLDEAMRLLSKVINADVISSLRLKAMFLRANLYEQQGRPELALKQLESTARKGGEWAQKAKEKLENYDGYRSL